MNASSCIPSDVVAHAWHTVLRVRAMRRVLNARRGKPPQPSLGGAFVAGANRNAVASAWAVALAIDAAALETDGTPHSSLPWAFTGPRGLVLQLHRGASMEAIFGHILEHGTAACGPAASAIGVGAANTAGEASAPGVVSGSAPSAGYLDHAVGFAKAQQLHPRLAARCDSSLVACPTLAFLEASQVATAPFHTALNFAGVWNVPVLFVATGGHLEAPVDTAEAYGVASTSLAKPDATAWFQAVRRAAQTRSPHFLWCNTAKAVVDGGLKELRQGAFDRSSLQHEQEEAAIHAEADRAFAAARSRTPSAPPY